MSTIEVIRRQGADRDLIELTLGYRELVLIHRALEAISALDLVARQDDLLSDTIQLIDVALEEAR